MSQPPVNLTIENLEWPDIKEWHWWNKKKKVKVVKVDFFPQVFFPSSPAAAVGNFHWFLFHFAAAGSRSERSASEREEDGAQEEGRCQQKWASRQNRPNEQQDENSRNRSNSERGRDCACRQQRTNPWCGENNRSNKHNIGHIFVLHLPLLGLPENPHTEWAPTWDWLGFWFFVAHSPPHSNATTHITIDCTQRKTHVLISVEVQQI